MEERPDGTKLTSFRASLAAFAGLPPSGEPGSAEWNAAVASALGARAREGRGTEARAKLGGGALLDDSLYGTTPAMARLSRRMTVAEFNAVADAAGIAARAV